MTSPSQLRIKVFADGADRAGMLALYRNPLIKGFTTNPTLMRKAGIADYRGFAREVLAAIPDRPISFEVFSDDFAEMDRQAREIAAGLGVAGAHQHAAGLRDEREHMARLHDVLGLRVRRGRDLDGQRAVGGGFFF